MTMRMIRCANCNEPTGRWFETDDGTPEEYCRFCVNSLEVRERRGEQPPAPPRLEGPLIDPPDATVPLTANVRWTTLQNDAVMPDDQPEQDDDDDGQYRCRNCGETNCFEVSFSGNEHICRDDGQELFRPLIVDMERVRAVVTCYSCDAEVPERDWEWG